MKPYLALLLLLGIFSACRRPGAPFPRMCPSKDAYSFSHADTIQVTNCSERYSKQRWVLPDGSTSTNPSVYYVPNAAGTYHFKLYVSDDDFVNEYLAEKDIVVYE